MKEALEAVAVWLNLEDEYLFLSIYLEWYIRTKERNDSRRKR